MSVLYFDANAFVKGYVVERGSECVAQLFTLADDVFTCKVAFAEVMATLRRKRTEAPHLESDIDRIADQFDRDWRSITSVDLSPELLAVIREQAFRHLLKALDLLHLSAVVFLRRTTQIPVVFVSSDAALLAAARRESLPVFDPEVDDPATLMAGSDGGEQSTATSPPGGPTPDGTDP